MLLSLKASLALLWVVFSLLWTESASASTNISSTAAPQLTTTQPIGDHVGQNAATTHPTQAGAAASERMEQEVVTQSRSGLPPTFSGATAPDSTKTSDVAGITSDQLHQQSSTPSSDMAPLPELVSTTKPEVTSKRAPSSSQTQTPASTQSLGVPSASPATKVTESTTFPAAPAQTPAAIHNESAPLTSTATNMSNKTLIPEQTTTSTNMSATLASTVNKIAESTTFPSATTQTQAATHNESTPLTSATTEPSDNTTSPVNPLQTATSHPSTTNNMTESTAFPANPAQTLATTQSPGASESPSRAATTLGSTIKQTSTFTSVSSIRSNTPVTPPSSTVLSTTSSSTTITTNSTTPTGNLNPCGPKILPHPSNKSTATDSKSKPSSDGLTCSTHGVVKQCLIAIAALALLATIFMVTTIVLCAKLSTRKYKVRKRQPDTEMMCISSLLSERNYTYRRQRNPVSNGVLVMHTAGDSDDEAGDNLTLSSFLPENDRMI